MQLNVTVIKLDADKCEAMHVDSYNPCKPYIAYWRAPHGQVVVGNPGRDQQAALDELRLVIREFIANKPWESVEDFSLHY